LIFYLRHQYDKELISSTQPFGSTAVHRLRSNVYCPTTDAFAWVNTFSEPRDGNFDEKVLKTVGEILDHVADYDRIDGEDFLVLIPFNNTNTHWYLMCICIEEIQCKLIVFNSIESTDFKKLTESVAANVIKSASILIKTVPSDCEIIRSEADLQNNGSDCGIFTANVIARAVKHPEYIKQITPVNKPLSKRQRTPTQLNVKAARCAMQWILFDLVRMRQSSEDTASISMMFGKRDFDPSADHIRLVGIVRKYMNYGDVSGLFGLEEYNHSITDCRDFCWDKGGSSIGDFDATYYREGGAPYFTQFYAGSVPTTKPANKPGMTFTFKELLEISQQEHDANHYFIQIAFATRSRSMYNPDACLLTKADVDFIRSSELIRARHNHAIWHVGFLPMGIHYNPHVIRQSLCVVDNELYNARVLKETHYRKRITRLISHLRLTGYDSLACDFYSLLMKSKAGGKFQNLSAETEKEWCKAMTSPICWT